MSETAEDTVKKLTGRPSKFAGKMVHATVDENPRREGTHGRKSFDVLLANPNGMTYEEFISAGGRRNDLLYDVERGRASIQD